MKDSICIQTPKGFFFFLLSQLEFSFHTAQAIYKRYFDLQRIYETWRYVLLPLDLDCLSASYAVVSPPASSNVSFALSNYFFQRFYPQMFPLSLHIQTHSILRTLPIKNCNILLSLTFPRNLFLKYVLYPIAISAPSSLSIFSSPPPPTMYFSTTVIIWSLSYNSYFSGSLTLGTISVFPLRGPGLLFSSSSSDLVITTGS